MSVSKDIRLMVKRVFITSDLGEDAIPKWASWVKVVVDGLFSMSNLPPQLFTNI
jgi:HSP90 family molecular chaperone